MIDVVRPNDTIRHLMVELVDRVALCGEQATDWQVSVPRLLPTCVTCAAVEERWTRAAELREEIDADRAAGLEDW